jgi:DNA/RNA-binding domain of Phe-tRNA-synthetase-like protein
MQAISEYRKIIKRSGSDPDSHMPSPEALIKRVVSGKGLYTINTAVDAYNLAVVESGIGLGGFNMENLKYPVTLRFAQKGETMNLLGKEGVTELKERQIIYADNEKPITMDLNYRDIEETKIDENSTHIILFADGAPGLDKQEVLAALQKGVDYIIKFCGGTQGKIYLIE